MCIIERFHFVHPDGTRQLQELLRHCDRGRPNAPCNLTRVVNLEDRIPPPAPIIETRAPRRESRHESTRKPGNFFNGLRIGLSLENPFKIRRRYTSKSERPKLELIREKSQRSQHSQRSERVRPHQPQLPQEPPQGMRWHNGPGPQEPQGEPRIIQLPMYPPEPRMRDMGPHYEPEIWHPRRSPRRPPPVVPIHFQDGDDSPPYTTPTRQHRRRARTNSPTRPYEEHKRIIEEKERRQAAEWYAQDLEREKREVEKTNRDLNREAENAKRKTANARREAENNRLDRDRAIERSRQLAREKHAESEEKRILQEENDRITRRLRECVISREQEQQRLERAQRAGIRRQPRHENVLHHGGRGSLEERGDRVLREDILAANNRQAGREPQRGWSRTRDDGRGHRRRDRAANGQRIVYEDDRRRIGRRWF